MRIQLDEQNEYLREIPQGNFKFSDTVFQPAHTLTPEQCAHFRVHTLVTVSQPEHNALTHLVRAADPVLIAGQWTQQWEVLPLPAEEVAANFAAAREAAWNRIKTERDRRKYLGVKVGSHWLHSDDPSRIQQLGLARKADRLEASGGSMDTPFSGSGPGGILAWKTIGGSFAPMTPTLAQQISEAVEALDLGVFAAAEVHRMAMEASDSPESYDFSGGWPASIEDTP